MLVKRLVILAEVFFGLPQSFQANAGVVLRLGHKCFLPYYYSDLLFVNHHIIQCYYRNNSIVK